MNTPSSENRPSGPAVEPVHQAGHDPAVNHHLLTWAILGGCGLLAILIVVWMWPIYVPEMHRYRAEVALREGKPANAVPHLIALSQRGDKDAAKYLGQLGDAYLGLKEPAKALDAFEQSLAKNSSQNLDEKLGICYARMGQQAKAMEYFQKVLKRQPSNPAVNFFLGVTALEQKQYEQAGRCFYLAGGDPKWDKEAAPYRERLAAEALGALASPVEASTTSTLSATSATLTR